MFSPFLAIGAPLCVWGGRPGGWVLVRAIQPATRGGRAMSYWDYTELAEVARTRAEAAGRRAALLMWDGVLACGPTASGVLAGLYGRSAGHWGLLALACERRAAAVECELVMVGYVAELGGQS